MIRLIPRDNPASISPLFGIGGAFFATMLVGGTIFAVLGYNPASALFHLFITPISTPFGIVDLLIKSCPLVIMGLGLSFCFRANTWNIGAEGQYIIGALAAGWLALSAPPSFAPILLPAMVVMALVGGAAWAGIAAILKTRFSTNEILVTLMLNYIASLILDIQVRGALRDPASFGFPQTPIYPDAALIGKLSLPVSGSFGQLHYGIFLIIILPVLGWWVMRRTLIGFSIRVVGDAPTAARYAGFSRSKITIGVMLISGGLAGLAGMIEVSANIERLQPSISFGYGFTAIIVAFLARLNPLGVIIAGLVVALMELGGDVAQIHLGIPKVVTGIFKGILLFFLLAAATLQRYRIEVDHWGKKS